MTHSKMVQTRRRREAAKKRQARREKLQKKLAQQHASTAVEVPRPAHDSESSDVAAGA